MIIQGKKISPDDLAMLKKQGFRQFRGRWSCQCNHIADRDGSISLAVSMGLKPSSKYEMGSIRSSWIVSI
jgi:hypothetical protein